LNEGKEELPLIHVPDCSDWGRLITPFSHVHWTLVLHHFPGDPRLAFQPNSATIRRCVRRRSIATYELRRRIDCNWCVCLLGERARNESNYGRLFFECATPLCRTTGFPILELNSFVNGGERSPAIRLPPIPYQRQSIFPSWNSSPPSPPFRREKKPAPCAAVGESGSGCLGAQANQSTFAVPD
jgi:hypothetical protein